jgi:hypothetical protein
MFVPRRDLFGALAISSVLTTPPPDVRMLDYQGLPGIHGRLLKSDTYPASRMLRPGKLY